MVQYGHFADDCGKRNVPLLTCDNGSDAAQRLLLFGECVQRVSGLYI